MILLKTIFNFDVSINVSRPVIITSFLLQRITGTETCRIFFEVLLYSLLWNFWHTFAYYNNILL